METSGTSEIIECQKIPFIPPPYCRKAENRSTGIESKSLHLELLVSNPSKLLLLSKTLTDCCSKALEVKLNTYLMKEADCKCVFLLHFFPSFQEAVVQTLGKDELETSLRFPISEEIINLLIKNNDGVFKCDENLTPQIRDIFNKMFKDLSYRIIAVPIIVNQEYYPCSFQPIQPLFLTCFVDSAKVEDHLVALSNELFKYCLPILLNTMALEEEARQKQQYQLLLTVIRNLLGSLEDINGLATIITEESRKITNAGKCSLFLSDPNQVYSIKEIFNIFAVDKKTPTIKTLNDRFIPNYATTTGNILNIQMDKRCEWMNKSLSEYTGFETKNILCFPIKNDNDIIGAVQVCNKRHGNFTCFDEEITSLLSNFCGTLITHGIKYAELENYKFRSNLSNELMIYQCQVDEDSDVMDKVTCPLIHSYPDFDLFSFSPRIIVESESVCFVLQMFEKLEFFNKFKIDRTTFTRFVAHIKNGSRKANYHNWMHLFATSHFAYLCLKNLNLLHDNYITDLEGLAYFMTCLCHDVDYRGTSNPFEETTIKGAMASLYSSFDSVMERHRLSQVFRIFQNESCNFLQNFDNETYGLFLNLMKDFVLATDQGASVKLYKRQYDMVKGGYIKNNPEHRYNLMTLMVTAADLSDFTKEWSVVREQSVKMFQEYFNHNIFHQEDLKTIMLPNLQIEFLRKHCLTPFMLLGTLFEEFKTFVNIIKGHIFYWEVSKFLFQKGIDEGTPPMKILTKHGFDETIEATIRLLEPKENE